MSAVRTLLVLVRLIFDASPFGHFVIGVVSGIASDTKSQANTSDQ